MRSRDIGNICCLSWPSPTLILTLRSFFWFVQLNKPNQREEPQETNSLLIKVCKFCNKRRELRFTFVLLYLHKEKSFLWPFFFISFKFVSTKLSQSERSFEIIETFLLLVVSRYERRRKLSKLHHWKAHFEAANVNSKEAEFT